MDKSVATRIAKRFITLPLDKRREYLEKMLAEGVSPANLPIPEVCGEFDSLPLSYAQERQWFLWQLDPASAAYHIPTALRLRGPLDVCALEHSFNALVARHASLRTTFAEVDGRAVQVVAERLILSIDQEQLEGDLDTQQQDESIKAFVEHETQQPFDLACGPLLRVKLLRLAAEDHVLVLTQHHIVSDGASMQIMVRELVQAYTAYCQGQSPQWDALPIQYADYAIWQRHWMEAGERDRQLGYWREQLGGEQPVLELPTDSPRPAVQSLRGARINLTLDRALSQALRQVAKAAQATPFMLLLASYQALLQRYSRQHDIRVGVPVANRNRVESEGLLGFFVNTQVLRSQVDDGLPFDALLQQVRQATMEAQAHQDLPFEQLVQALHPERSMSHSPLFQVMFNHQVQGAANDAHLPAAGLALEGLSWDNPTAQFDLTLATVDDGEHFSATFTYATDLFQTATIERMAQHWQTLLNAIVTSPALPLAELPLLDEQEQHALQAGWSSTTASYARTAPVHQLFEAQADRHPDAPALIFEGRELTYAKLNEQANRLAHRLIEQGVGPQTLVGLALERSVEMLVGLLAVLKSGAAYIPLDPAYPQERLAYMIEDSGIHLLLTQDFLLERIPVPAGVTHLVLNQRGDWLLGYPTTNPALTCHPEQLAYTLYTSGSTGKPKGVMIDHGALANFVASIARSPGIARADRMLSLTTFSFDIFGLEIYVPLSHGACIVMTPAAMQHDPDALLALVRQQRISVLQATPSTWRILMENPTREVLRHCKLLCGGEALPDDLAVQMTQLSEQVWNLYGPTETTIWSAQHALTRQQPRPLLGQPLANTSLVLLDDHLGLVPAGVAAELLIGGDGLARGYLQRPSLTAERFVPHPFAKAGERLYRTGDLVRSRANGELEYLGRLDHQVKVRGLRIELGEIESRLLNHPHVRQAAVAVQQDMAGAHLVAYLIGQDESEAARAQLLSELKTLLRQHLADYMIPSHWLFLTTMPLTPNGKLDRKALPRAENSQARTDYVAPRNLAERTVASIWQQVLEQEQVGIHDDFFALGGHSLLATQVVSRVRHALQREVSLKSLFEHSILEAFVQSIGIADTANQPALAPVPRAPHGMALSYAQERQWFLWQLDPQSTAYHIPVALRLHGQLDLAALQRSFDSLLARHEVLRTTFSLHEQLPRQIIQPEGALAIHVATLQPSDDPNVAIAQFISQRTQTLFDLQQGPVIRVDLLQVAADDHVLVITTHHIASDAWSMQVMVQELIALYAGFSKGEPQRLPPLALQYADYAQWQRQWMDAGERERQLAYWVAQLESEAALLELPYDRARPAEQSFNGARIETQLPEALGASLRGLAKQHNVTPFMVLLASFQLLLHRYSRQEDVRVGVPVANRNRLETEQLIGFFVNTQVLKAQIDSQMTVTELLQQVRHTALEAQTHQDLPFEHLVDALRPERTLSHSPLFQVMFNHQSDASQGKASAQLPALTIETLPWQTSTAQFDLTLNTFEASEGFSASLTYATDLFDAATARRMLQHWQNLLQAMVDAPAQRLAQLPLENDAQLHNTFSQWNPTTVEHSAETCLHRLIEAQASKAPGAVALTFEDQHLTYAQLNAQANALAHQLIALNVQAETRVGLACERSPEMLVGMLAILKAGAAYVPLDPAYPNDRLAYMIEDSDLGLILTQAGLHDQLPVPAHVRTLLIEACSGSVIDTGNPDVMCHPDNLAYVIYTSGSTGKPKGALLTHRNVLRLFQAAAAEFQVDERDVWSLFHSYAFDFSVWEIFGALLYGGRLVIVPHTVSRSPEDFYRLLCREGVTVLNQTPSAFKQLMQVACATSAAQGTLALRYVVFGGEALEVQSLRPWFEHYGDHAPQLINMYGITETTVHVTYRPITLADLAADVSSPIGLPLNDLSWYLLDANLNPVALGCVGELYIAGAGLARGYLNRTDLTALRFVPSPFGAAGERLYRTGDLARYRNDGVIEYIGRIDHQVKIRGFRIELGEIEAQLLRCAQVSQVVVLAQPGPSGQPQLVAYIVTDSANAVDGESLRAAIKATLKDNLPDYMVPNHLLLLTQLPLTTNGKLDRKALPLPDLSQAQQAYVAPGNELQQQLAGIWQDVLKLANVGINDNFFELGGDSIISIQVVSRAREAGIVLTPKDLFQHQTVATLARVARQVDKQALIDQGPLTGATPLLPIQQAFFAMGLPTVHHWNQSVLLQPSAPLSVGLLKQALQALLAHHDALRLCFSQGSDGWQASFHDQLDIDAMIWQRSADSAEALQRLCEEAQQSLDIHAGTLLRAMLVNLQDGSQRLQLVVHHLAVDGVSWRILFNDLQRAYRQAQAGEPITFAARSSSVRDWAERLTEHAHSPALNQQLPYWQAQLHNAHTDLPSRHGDGTPLRCHARTVRSRLDAQATRRLLQEAPAAYRTQVNDLLLTALARVIARWTGGEQCVVQLEGHGREDLFDSIDLTRSVGWFTSLFPVKLSAQGELGNNLLAVKEQLRAIPDKGLGYGLLRYLGTAEARATLTGLAEPRITFNYLGQFDASFETPDGNLFSPAPESSGSERDQDAPLDNWLSINGQVYGGELSLGWTFSTAMFDPSTIQALADAYADELNTLIEYCCIGEHSGVSPSDFPLARLTQEQIAVLPVKARDIEDIYPLTPMQQGMLFHTQDATESALYINQIAVTVEHLDTQRFTTAWNAVIRRHEILRTGFWASSSLAEPLQIVYRHAQIPLRTLDLSGQPQGQHELEGLARDDASTGFDLLGAPLLRLTLARLDAQRTHLVWTSHHILMDGWSTSRLLGEVLQTYHGVTAEPKTGRYRDYIQWLKAQSLAQQEQFWKGKLAQCKGTHLANTVQPSADAGLAGHAALYLTWDPARTQHLRTCAQRLRITPNTLIQATWALLLQRYTGQAEVCFGATVAGRPTDLAGANEMLGLFINTLPIIQCLQPDMPVAQWLQALQDYNLEIRDYEHTALADIQRWSGQGGSPLFDSIVVFENYPIDERLQEAEQDQLRFGEVKTRDVTNYAMDLAVNLGNTLSIEFLYLRNRFTEQATAQIRNNFETLLQALLDHPQDALGSLDMLATDEHRQLALRNQLRAPGTAQGLLASDIRHQATQRPEAQAVVCAGVTLSYAQLEQRANQLAHQLIALGIGPERFVGVALERSVDVIVAFYAVMKTGAAYVPLDIDYPQDRVQWIVQDSGMDLLLTHDRLRVRFAHDWAPPLLALDQLAEASPNYTCPANPALADNLAYLIYTSGSTGKPKGVAVSHGQIHMHCHAIVQRYEMDTRTCELLFMSFAFDGAQERWLSTLVSGGCLVVRDNQLWTVEETWHALHRHGISIACFPPAYLQQLAEFAQTQAQPAPPVGIYCFGGDAVAEANFELVKRTLKPRYLTNGYGPTETVVTPLLWKVPADATCKAVYAPIGERVGERSLYILDDALNPLPTGVAGELYIGGEGVARGYHHRPGLSAERFIADPFSSTGGRLYRTGDLVRQRADGMIDYLGRLDNQVKIRGFRIELGEIEARLRQQPGVQDAVVVARDTANGKQLVGYVVAARQHLGENLRSALQGELPDYMVPVQVLLLDSLPLNPNGKVDRLALPAPDFTERTFVAPRNAVEQGLAKIWQAVLDVEQVGVTDNFFELGGDSLRILKVLSSVRNQPELGLELKLRDMIGKPTIAELSGYQPEQGSLDPLLLLNSRCVSTAPLFCLHAGFGTVFDYEPLARKLDGHRSVYGLQCRMLLDRDWQDESLPTMAIDYAHYIRHKQPEGPYHLLGWSLGGALAMLVAQELESQGQEVAFTGLVDSFLPVTGDPVEADDDGSDLRGFLAMVLGVEVDQLPMPAELACQPFEQLINTLRARVGSGEGLTALTAEELAHTFTVAMKLKAVSALLEGLPSNRCSPVCWWAGQSDALTPGPLPGSAADTWLDVGHYDILKHHTLLNELAQALVPNEALAP